MDIIVNNMKTNIKNIYKISKRNYLEKTEFDFKKKHTWEKRKEESEKILAKYPERIPVIVERFSEDLPELDRKKYLVPDDLTMANFMYVIRKRIKLEAERSIFLFVNNKILQMSTTIGVIYDKYSDEDGFLYIKYCGETTFG